MPDDWINRELDRVIGELQLERNKKDFKPGTVAVRRSYPSGPDTISFRTMKPRDLDVEPRAVKPPPPKINARPETIIKTISTLEAAIESSRGAAKKEAMRNLEVVRKAYQDAQICQQKR